MAILDVLSNPQLWNAIGSVGEGLQSASQGRAANQAPYIANSANIKQRQRAEKARERIFGGGAPQQGQQPQPGILGQMDPRQRQALELIYETNPQAAMQIIAQQQFPQQGDPTARYKVVGGRLVDLLGPGGPSVAIGAEPKQESIGARYKVVDGQLIDLMAEGGPSVAVEAQPQGPMSAIAKLFDDYKNQRISAEDYQAGRAKILQPSQGITIGPDGTVQIGGANAPAAIKTEAIKGRNAYDSIMSGLDNFEGLIEKQGAVVLPGEEKEAYNVARRSLQLQMKELFNLGVLNGPDLELMDQLLIDPTDWSGAAMDATGYQSVQERGKANIKQLRQMMTELIAPKLESVGAAAPSGAAPAPAPSYESTQTIRGVKYGFRNGEWFQIP